MTAWRWLRARPLWAQLAIGAALAVVAVLLALRLWDALWAFFAVLLGIGTLRATRGPAVRPAAREAEALTVAVEEAREAHADADAAADAALEAADAATLRAIHAAAPTDDLAPQRSRYLGER